MNSDHDRESHHAVTCVCTLIDDRRQPITARAATLLVYVIAWARGQLRNNFTRIFKVFTKLPESRSDEGNLENFENASEINP